MNADRIRRLTVALAVAVAAGVLSWPASPAAAHPRGNFSVNQYAGLTLHPDRVDVTAVVDVAEIPTLQDRARADTDGDGTLSEAERAGYATAECARLADGFAVTADAKRLVWTVSRPAYEVVPGTGGLSTSRLDCLLSAPAPLDVTAELRVDNGYRVDRVGWRELSASGAGVIVAGSTVPAASVSGQLRAYPADLLSSALDVRTATIRLGGAGGAGVVAGAADIGGPGVFEAGPEWLASAQSRVESALGGQLTPLVVGLAFLLALVLGAGHAVLPGHGKTVMAAYFAGRQGRIRDAFAVGGAVTLAHTGTVLVLGLLLSTSTVIAGERVLTVLGVISGLLVVLVGTAMLVSARRSRAAGRPAEIGAMPGFASHSHGPGGHHHGAGGHHHHQAHAHAHAHSHDRSDHDQADPQSPDHSHHNPADPQNHDHSHHSPADPQSHDHSHQYRAQPGHDRLHHRGALKQEHGHEHESAHHEHGPIHHEHGPAHHEHGPAHHEHGPARQGRGPARQGRGPARQGRGPARQGRGRGRDRRRGLGLAGIGFAGGLVPSPSALVVLLGAIGLGRAGFGVALVIAYGVGMAATLTAVGLLLVVAQQRLARLTAAGGWTGRLGTRLSHLGGRLAASTPTATAALVVVVGLGIGFRAIA
jgi:nickel/cobalt exporter